MSLFALSMMELLVLAALLIFLIIGAGYDRNGRAGVKWLAVISLCAGWALFHDWTGGFWDVLHSVFNAEFWLPVAAYVAFGLIIYSPIEFRMEIRGSARRMRERWDEFLTKNPEVRARKLMSASEVETEKAQLEADEAQRQAQQFSILAMATKLITDAGVKLRGGEDNALSQVQEEQERRRQQKIEPEKKVSEFVDQANRRHYGYVSDIIRLKANGIDIDTQIHRPGLVQSIACWTFMWPAYAASLVLGNFVVEFFETVVDLTQKWANERLKKAFDGVFAVK